MLHFIDRFIISTTISHYFNYHSFTVCLNIWEDKPFLIKFASQLLKHTGVSLK